MHKITNNKEVMNGKNRLNSNSGITLIALVITIIVLLILAGVTLSLTLGENGLIKRAQGAEGEHTKSSIQEELEMDIADIIIQKDGKPATKEEIANKIGDKVTIIDIVDNVIEGEYKDYEFEIDEDNNVIVGGKLVGEKPVGIVKIITTDEVALEVKLQVIGEIKGEEKIVSIEAINKDKVEAIEDPTNGDTSQMFKVTDNGRYTFKIKASNRKKCKSNK